MKLLVGLGNPGGKYARNRHNIGYRLVERIAADHSFGPWKSKFQGLLSEGRLAGERVALLKPETFMNLSGQSVAAAQRFYKIDVPDVVVFHDELDLQPGKMRLKSGGGHAGHNGLRSLHQHLGAEYQRVRIGIGHPGHKDRVAGYVLHDFAAADSDWIADILQGVSDGIMDLVKGDNGRFMNKVALRTNPPRSSTSTPKAATKTAKSKPAVATIPPETPTDPRTALQRLADRFR